MIKYRFTILLLLVAGSVQNSSSQELPKIRKLGNDELIQNVDSYKLISAIKTSELKIRLFEKENSSGNVGSDSVVTTSNYLIMVSQFSEPYKENLFEVGPFYLSMFVRWSGKDDRSRELTIKYGQINNKRYITFLVSINELKKVE